MSTQIPSLTLAQVKKLVHLRSLLNVAKQREIYITKKIEFWTNMSHSHYRVLEELQSSIYKLENAQLLKVQAECKHERGPEYFCARDDCSGGHANCVKCGARRI